MKRLDILAKPEGPEIRKTLIGGLATLLMIVFYIFLLLKEYDNF